MKYRATFHVQYFRGWWSFEDDGEVVFFEPTTAKEAIKSIYGNGCIITNLVVIGVTSGQQFGGI